MGRMAHRRILAGLGIMGEITIRQGLRSRLMTKLARLFDSTRFERRALKTGKLGILLPLP